MERVGFGLIGCGVWGSVHARTYASSPYSQLVAVCDEKKDRAERFKKDYAADISYTDWRRLLDNPDVAAISVATPDFAHTDILLAAIEAGKHVLVEKPLATTVKDCKKIIAAREKKGVTIMVDFHNRWNVPFVHIKRMVDSGELGDLIMMNIRLNDTLYVPTKMLIWAAKSSPAFFLGSHLVDLVRWLTGAEIVKVFSVSRSIVLKKRGIETPDFFQTILELTNGGTAFIENCWVLAENAPNIFEFKGEFVGTKGCTYVDVSHNRIIEKYTENGPGLPDVIGAPDLHGKPVGFCTESIHHFIDCIVHGKTPLATAEDGLAAAHVVEAIITSAKTGKPVNL